MARVVLSMTSILERNLILPPFFPLSYNEKSPIPPIRKSGNILGLLPAAANLTGNIAVTMTLALLTFLITNLSGNKNYWKHIFWTPNVPNVMRIIIFPIEIIGVFTKPFSLMIRLFVAITAGHIVLLSFIGMTFIFQSYFVGILSSLFAVLLNIIELLVAVIQAYVFTMFSSFYIGLAIEEQH